ncbi:Hypothetical protein NTJ_13376 [Nesidiocoris tenuis]|uniref:Uncharacterized protein n=1 Tax=Nesidiocoris tenuis TaxID=355587 RepID=A0ABN7BAB0_9HEMI|nr:Hypothetical protein NTJ_13376 [Nesidiocoris tenuis]
MPDNGWKAPKEWAYQSPRNPATPLWASQFRRRETVEGKSLYLFSSISVDILHVQKATGCSWYCKNESPLTDDGKGLRCNADGNFRSPEGIHRD